MFPNVAGGLASSVQDALHRTFMEHIRYNGPEFISKAIHAWQVKFDVKDLYIEPGSPWENGYTESFNSRPRDELLMVEQFRKGTHALASANAWREDYNNYRAHNSLGCQTPKEFARRCASSVPAAPSLQQYSDPLPITVS